MINLPFIPFSMLQDSCRIDGNASLSKHNIETWEREAYFQENPKQIFIKHLMSGLYIINFPYIYLDNQKIYRWTIYIGRLY